MPRKAQRRNRLLTYFELDMPAGRAQPLASRWIIATILAIIGSVTACAALAALGQTVLPSTRGYEHFAFSDYARLTVVGVLIACAGWPVTTLLSSRASRLYLWAWIVLAVGSLAPDVWILAHRQDPAAVFTLALMHVAVAAITCVCMLTLAPQRDRGTATR